MKSALLPSQNNGSPLWHLDALGLLAIGFVSALCWFALISPALSRSQRETDAASSLASVTAESQDLSRAISNQSVNLLRAQAELAGFDQPCWTDSDRSRRLEWLYSIARARGLSVDSVEPSEIESIAGRRALPIRLSARGPFMSVVATLADLKHAMPDMVVRSFDLNPGSAETREVTLALELFWVPVQGETADSSAPPGVTTSFAPGER